MTFIPKISTAIPANIHDTKLSGLVRLVTYHSIETGYSIIKINTFDNPKEDISVSVHQTKVFAGSTMSFVGSWVNNPKYGWQFKADEATVQKPATVYALEKYIGSGLIKGIGPAIAKRIVKHFGDKTLDIFDSNIHRLEEISGISKSKLKVIQTCWVEHQKIRDVMMFLQQNGISTLFAVKIYKVYGDKAIEIVGENPYRLAQDIYGIGFMSADKIALQIGIVPNSLKRITAGIDSVLQASRDDGHCYLTHQQITKRTIELLSLTVERYQSLSQQKEVNFSENDFVILPEQVSNCLLKMEESQELKVRILTPGEIKIDGEDQDKAVNEAIKCYYAKSIYYDELAIAELVKELSKYPKKLDLSKLQDWLKRYYDKFSIKLSDEQEAAVMEIVQNQFSILTGGPGCGKTTTTKVLVDMARALKKTVMLCAPTGRASQRMTEVIGIEAKTIHRLLEFDPSQGGFKRNKDNLLDTDFLIVDESSMLDVHLAAALLKAVPNTAQVLFIGDTDQLPSVGAGNILKDIINSGQVKVCTLTQIFRQAQSSSIIQFAHQINKGNSPKIPSPFQLPSLWQDKIDCMFIDSQEATNEQLKFISKVKNGLYNPKNIMNPTVEQAIDLELNGLDIDSDVLNIPKKFEHVDIQKLLQSKTSAEELKAVMESIPFYSSLHYGLEASSMIKKLYQETIPKYYPNQEIQILSPMTKGSLGSIKINQMIQQTINPPKFGKAQVQIGAKFLRVGDRVIQKINNYTLNVFNGDIGEIIEIDSEDVSAVVEFGGLEKRAVIYDKSNITEIDLAYAVTIHKSQGSEFGVVIIPILTQHYQMLFRNLIYTGLTRAKKLAIFVGSRKALNLAVRNMNTSQRQTALEYLLRGN